LNVVSGYEDTACWKEFIAEEGSATTKSMTGKKYFRCMATNPVQVVFVMLS
jgi:hypothetical protein